MSEVKTDLSQENSGFRTFLANPVIATLRWRSKTITSILLTSPEDLVSNVSSVATPGTSESLGAWTNGGSTSVSRQVCKWQNGSGFFFRRSFAAIYRPYLSWNYVHVSGEVAWQLTDVTPEIDWEDTMVQVRATYPAADYDILAVRFCNSIGDNCIDLVSEGIIDLDELNNYYRDTSHTGEEITGDLWSFNKEQTSYERLVPYGPGGSNIPFQYTNTWTIDGITDDDAGLNFNETAHDLSLNTCTSNSRSIPMYLKVWVFPRTGVLTNPEETVVEESPQLPDLEDTEGFSGTSGSTGSGSTSQGSNPINTLYGNTRLPFDSIYLTGSNYNSLVSAGSGVVTASGVFPKSDSIYIEEIRLDVEGSSMTVVEVVEYDAVPSLALSEKIYAYIFNENNYSQPIFTGFVIGRRRRLTGQTKEIVYECRDLSYFLDQLYSPSYYLYQPPQPGQTGTFKTYDRVLKEILNIGGLPDAIVDIPNYAAPPTEWIYQDLRGVLEWVVKFFGKYVYYIDRHGRLNVRATDSLSNVKTYTVGDKLEEVSIERFEPIADVSRSRSRLVLTGSYGLEERTAIGKYRAVGPVNPENAGTGFYWYYKDVNIYGYTKFYYFSFSSVEPFLEKLLSDQGASAKVSVTISTKLSSGVISTTNIELPISYFQSSVSGSKILSYFDLNQLPTGTILPKDLSDPGNTTFTFSVTYAKRSLEPIQVIKDTGLFGGTEVIKRPEFKKVISPLGSIDDTVLMRQYIEQIKSFYKPVYGGTLLLDGLDTEIYLLSKVSIAGTDLSSTETNNLICYGITYRVPEKRTVVELSNKVYGALPFFDIMRERSSSENEVLSKLSLIDETERYKRR